MKKPYLEMAVGVFVLIGILCTGYLTVKLGKIEWIRDNHYPVFAKFHSVSGLKPGAYVEMAGVEIGKVDHISLEPESQLALVKLKLRKDVAVTDDVIASVTTAGLIGDKKD